MRATRSILAVASILVMPVLANAAPEIAVGAKVPAGFVAKATDGTPRNLGAIMGRKGVVLVLFRSARWCPFCQLQLKSLKDVQAPLAQRGYTLAALSYDSPAALKTFSDKFSIEYPLLSDEKSVVIDSFGLRDPTYPTDSFASGVPKASILIVSPKGVVRWKSVATDYKIRPENAKILAAIDQLPPR